MLPTPMVEIIEVMELMMEEGKEEEEESRTFSQRSKHYATKADTVESPYNNFGI